MGSKLRFKVGDRVNCARGVALGSTGRIARRVTAQSPNPLSRMPDWIVRLDKPIKLGSSDREEVWFHDDELEPWTVPLEARPASVGALQHPARLYLDRHSLSEPCNVCSAKIGEPCRNLLTGSVLPGTHTQAPPLRIKSISIRGKVFRGIGEAKVTRG
jgi:hypothetical protein